MSGHIDVPRAIEGRIARAGLLVLAQDPAIRDHVRRASEHATRPHHVVEDARELLAAVELAGNERRPCVVVLEAGAQADQALRELAGSAARDKLLVILVARDLHGEPPAGAHVVTSAPALREVLALATRAHGLGDGRRLAVDRLLAVSVLSGPLEQVLESAADELATGFGVDRCVISVRGDSTGGGAVGDRTWDSLAWSQTAERCRTASAAVATLIAPHATPGGPCESYLAVPLATPLGSHGFIGLVTGRPHVFARSDRAALQAVASRLGSELGWRGVHERTADELDRCLNSPGLDAVLGIWNRIALAQLIGMQVSAALRGRHPLTVLAIDVIDLQSINTRHGHETGDRLLHRIADALRTTVRAEDLVGRWAGDKLVVVLPSTAFEGARRVAERLQSALAARSLELPGGATLEIPATIGIAALDPNEDAARLVARALWAARKARDGGASIIGASTGPAPRLSQPLELADELRGTLGGTYRLLHEISRGGMGVVYRAEDLALERPVAIKMLRPDLAEDRGFVESLRNEAALLARLQHPNLVQIYNFGQIGGDSYFVMELVEGEGLQQAVERHRIEDTAMPLAEAVAAIEQVGSALDALHDRGIVHRDVKPGNVIRDPFRNRCVLVDVGIARRYGQFAESAGTPGYAAPEVILGGEASAQSDVYGLAATAYTILTLTAPWGDDEHVLARQVGGESVVPPSALRGELAAADEILLAGLSRDPSRRPASAVELARALSHALAIQHPIMRDAPRAGDPAATPHRHPSAKTRGVVFRSIVRAVGAREAERLRDAIGGDHPELARAISDMAPLAWIPTELLTQLLAVAPPHVGRDASQLARDVARATVRATFRRFFPASAATLIPERTLSAIRNVWSRYHSWGTVASMPVHSNEMVIRITDTPREPDLCAWASGMLEQLVVLSGGRAPSVDHESCEARGDPACLYRINWERGEAPQH
ncbi:MAG TPA: diguanylate cyclase [Kofleriaceae bacterium]|nr:diguanylate cyclase [Kofleriaceae bacterium]